jgi:hypothetical protein
LNIDGQVVPIQLVFLNLMFGLKYFVNNFYNLFVQVLLFEFVMMCSYECGLFNLYLNDELYARYNLIIVYFECQTMAGNINMTQRNYLLWLMREWPQQWLPQAKSQVKEVRIASLILTTNSFVISVLSSQSYS